MPPASPHAEGELATDKPVDQELQDAFSELILHSRQLNPAADGIQADMERIQRIAMAQQQQQRERQEGGS